MKADLFVEEGTPLLASNVAEEGMPRIEDDTNSPGNRNVARLFTAGVSFALLFVGLKSSRNTGVPEEIKMRVPVTGQKQSEQSITSVTKRLTSYGCDKRVAKNLGTGHETPEICAAAALVDPACTGNEIMFSQEYNSDSGCSCCIQRGYSHIAYMGYTANPNWDIYKYVGSVKATERLTGFSCFRFDVKNMGNNYVTPDECADAAFRAPECTSNEIMWSPKAWGCHCCGPKPPGEDEKVYNKVNYWSIYQYDLTTPEPTPKPTDQPTATPTDKPTSKPTNEPTVTASSSPTISPTPAPTDSPSLSPTNSPTTTPPTVSPTESPTLSPTVSPTESPTTSPTVSPTASPTDSPSAPPTAFPTNAPTPLPTKTPTASPTVSAEPSATPTLSPTPNECVACNEDSDCKPGAMCLWPWKKCSGVDGKMDLGCECNWNSDCRSGSCEGRIPAKCVPKLATGEGCNNDADCLSGECSWFKCK